MHIKNKIFMKSRHKLKGFWCAENLVFWSRLYLFYKHLFPIFNKNYCFGIFKVKYLESHYYLISSTTASAVVRLLTKFAVIAIASFPRNSFLLNYSLVMGCTIIWANRVLFSLIFFLRQFKVRTTGTQSGFEGGGFFVQINRSRHIRKVS